MRLNHLTLQGYKSFAAKTEFLFPTGITAIVGPNGSGKSNIADAIRWVLGEQRMRTLRGKSTADMIFAGGRRRARAGMAAVSLTLDNSDGTLPVEFTTVTITRRAYRSGDNEYLLNGSRVRLKDITELLAAGGLGRRAYTVIGQGLVDAALSLRPQERRTLIEEAAGISLYRSQREGAVERLAETRRNLERVHDIIGEIAPRLRRLAREREKAEEHRRVTAHLERLQRTWYGYRWGRQQSALAAAQEREAALSAALDARRQEADALTAAINRLRQQEQSLREQLSVWHRESAALHERVNEARRELAVAEERARLLSLRREELLAELGPLREQLAAQEEKIAQVDERSAALERTLAQRRAHLADAEREWAAARERAAAPRRQHDQAAQELRRRRAALERLGRTLRDLQAAESRLASERAVAEERVRQLEGRQQELADELAALEEQQSAQESQVAAARAAVADGADVLARARKALAAVQDDAAAPTDLSSALKREQARLAELERELAAVQAEGDQLRGEQAALERIAAAWEPYDAGVRALRRTSGAGVLGPLAALVRVPAEWERALEAALGDDWQAVVVERAAALAALEAALRSASSGGRLTLLPLDALRPPPPLPSGALRAAAVVTSDESLRPAIESLLGSVALCADRDEAQALLPDMPPGSRCVTADGLVLRADGGITVTAGKGRSAPVLEAERRRRELPARLSALDRRRAELEEARQRARARVAEAERRLEAHARQQAAEREAARTQVAVAEETLRSRRAALRREESLLERLRGRAQALRRQMEKLAAEREALVAQLRRAEDGPRDGFDARLEAVRRRRQEVEEQQRAAAERVADLETQLAALAEAVAAAEEEAARVERETVSPARTALAVAEEGLRSQRAARQREVAHRERLQAQIAARRQRAEELAAEQSALADRVAALRAEVEAVEAQSDALQARIRPAEAQLAALRQERDALETQEQQARERVREAESRRDRAQVEVARRRDELNLLAQRIEEDLGLVELELAENVTAQTLLPLGPLVSRLPVVEELPEGLEDEIRRLKGRLRRLGTVNPNAPEEYAEVQERHAFLTGQAADLEQATEQLQQVVAELDALMETTFRETFAAVAARFTEMFQALFDGGTARLELTTPDDPLNAGVEIIARPPGKRAQRLALLSGGERALTAAALLFALLHVSPTPFCVLDEVDAMLDEANVGRFREVLKGLAQKTQFIVITHTRGTVEAADAVYGVSMGSDGVSQVVSLRLEETTGADSAPVQ